MIKDQGANIIHKIWFSTFFQKQLFGLNQQRFIKYEGKGFHSQERPWLATLNLRSKIVQKAQTNDYLLFFKLYLDWLKWIIVIKKWLQSNTSTIFATGTLKLCSESVTEVDKAKSKQAALAMKKSLILYLALAKRTCIFLY